MIAKKFFIFLLSFALFYLVFLRGASAYYVYPGYQNLYYVNYPLYYRYPFFYYSAPYYNYFQQPYSSTTFYHYDDVYYYNQTNAGYPFYSGYVYNPYYYYTPYYYFNGGYRNFFYYSDGTLAGCYKRTCGYIDLPTTKSAPTTKSTYSAYS